MGRRVKLKIFSIVSPSGRTLTVKGETLYHAVEIAVRFEDHQYSNLDYLKLNKK